MATAVKVFTVEEGSVSGGWYEINVMCGGKVVKRFRRRTMTEAQRAFDQAGYKRVAWVEGRRIVLQDSCV